MHGVHVGVEENVNRLQERKTSVYTIKKRDMFLVSCDNDSRLYFSGAEKNVLRICHSLKKKIISDIIFIIFISIKALCF